MMDETLGKRFWSKVEKTEGCWLWKASLCTRAYGQFHHNGKNCLAHRLSYEDIIGKIPTGLTIDHLCRTRTCVNPNHMEVVTSKENVLRGEGFTAVNARKTHCNRDHKLAGDNLIPDKNGWRVCRECKRENQIKYRAR